MKLFLDTSVILAGCTSSSGASREIFRRSPINKWNLIVTPYVVAEIEANLYRMPPFAGIEWITLRSQLLVYADVFTINRPSIFQKSKDRPVLFAALAWADVLLTLDQRDFGELMGTPFYGLMVRRPGTFLEQ